ncbi:GNAT family N-acetyltransferase [Olivibacter sp. CPCC 100613]|uniref:GNAT family N-acetyltransferase n=1 Tax=Olivibacter sp. CPCC 100613 TaxID=3079931 RepID=UPI002FF741DA
MTVKFIPKEEVLPLRSLVLRDGKPNEFCVFPEDSRPETIHMGVIDDRDDQPKCVLTAFPQAFQDKDGYGFQLRGMATHPGYQRKGLGKQLVTQLINYLKQEEVTYVWCNARQVAFSFYQSIGFEFVSEAFDVPEIGPHKTMCLNL